MLLWPGSLRMLSKPSLSVSSCPLFSVQSLLPRSPLLLQTVLLSSLVRAKLYEVSRALRSNRSYTYSAATFDAALSRSPSDRDLHKNRRPSNELIRYMRRWEDELHFDARDARLRWTPQQRNVMAAACIEFRFYYNPNKQCREDRFEQAVTTWRKGLQVDAQSSQPRWNAAHRWKAEHFMKREEKRRAAEEVTRKHKSDYEWKAQFGGIRGKVKLGAQYFACGLLVLAFISFGPLLGFIGTCIMMPGV